MLLQGSKRALPEDLRMFYLIHNGLDLHWSYLHNGTAILADGDVYVSECTSLPVPYQNIQFHWVECT